MRSSSDATDERPRTLTVGDARLAHFKVGWEQMCSSFANQEGACAHVVCFAECLISLLGKPGSEGLKHIAPKLEEMMRLQNAAKRLFAKSSSIITEIDGIVSGEVGERNTAARKRMGSSPSSEGTPPRKIASRGREKGNGDHGTGKRSGAKNKNQTGTAAAHAAVDPARLPSTTARTLA